MQITPVPPVAPPATPPPFLRPPFVAGRWYPTATATLAAGVAAGANTIRLVPFTLTAAITISDLAARVGTLDAAGLFQLAIYNADATTGLPTTLVGATGDMSGATAALLSGAIAGGNKVLAVGTYWMAVNTNSATLAFQCISTAFSITTHAIGSATLANMSLSTGSSFLLSTFAQTYGTWPDLTGQTLGSAGTASAAFIYWKAA